MAAKLPNNPFENLREFQDLKRLTAHILKSIKVDYITAYIPSGIDKKLINDPAATLPIHYIVVGNATFQYIRHTAAYVLSNVHSRIEQINQNSELSIEDKIQEFQEVRTLIMGDYRYFDSMNPIRYMSAYNWRISYTVEEKKRTVTKEMNYPNSKLDLHSSHWNEIENTFSIRRSLLYEILFWIDEEIQKLQAQLRNTRYSWQGKEPYELHELLIALLASKRIKIEKGDENTFAHDFLSFFGQSDKRLSYSRDKVMSRQKRSQFLPVLEEALENSGLTKKLKRKS